MDYYLNSYCYMSGGYSGKLLQRQCKIRLSKDNLGEQNVLAENLLGFQRA